MQWWEVLGCTRQRNVFYYRSLGQGIPQCWGFISPTLTLGGAVIKWLWSNVWELGHTQQIQKVTCSFAESNFLHTMPMKSCGWDAGCWDAFLLTRVVKGQVWNKHLHSLIKGYCSNSATPNKVPRCVQHSLLLKDSPMEPNGWSRWEGGCHMERYGGRDWDQEKMWRTNHRHLYKQKSKQYPTPCCPILI